MPPDTPLAFDPTSLAIVLRLHCAPASALVIAEEIGRSPAEVTSRLSMLSALGIVTSGQQATGQGPASYALVPDAFRRLTGAREQNGRISRPVSKNPALAERMPLLRQVRLFAALDESDLRQVARAAQPLAFDAGEMIFLEGEVCQGIYIIESGAVKLIKHPSGGAQRSGREQMIGLLSAGDSFNEVPVFDGRPNPVSAQAVSASQILVIPERVIHQLLRRNPDFVDSVLLDFSSRLRHMLALVEDLSLRQVTGRVAKILLQSVEPIEGVGSGVEAHERLTQNNIAEMAGTAREVVARSLKQIEREGAIRIVRGRITIVDEDVLRMLT